MLMTDSLQDAKLDPQSQIIQGRAIWIESEMQPDDKMDMVTVVIDRASFPELTDDMILNRPSVTFLPRKVKTARVVENSGYLSSRVYSTTLL